MTKEEALKLIKLLSALEYDPNTGIFRWSSNAHDRVKNKQAGTQNGNGYIRIALAGKRYYAHRLAWLKFYGEMPDGEIDHINGIGNDNRIANLRLAQRSENAANQGKRSSNTTGFKGVSWSLSRKKFVAQITVNKKNKFLGHFSNPSDAHAAYTRAAKEFFGEFHKS